MLQMLGTDIERAFDLLPNDIREQCLRVQQERRLLHATPEHKAFDFFISHASEDKKDIALPLAQQLKSLGVSVWLDKFELKAGASLRQSLDNGLANSKYGIIIMSPVYFKKF